jgi:hypothetical protein
MKRSISLALLASTLAALAVGVSACSGSGDDVASPTPTPFNPDFCLIDWQVQMDADHYNDYRLFMLAARWSAGSNNYSDLQNVGNIFAYGIPNTATNLNQAAILGLSTSGDFTTTATGVEQGNNVTFNDSTPQAITQVGTDLQTKIGHLGSGGDGDFTGTWSNPSPGATPTLGTGTVHVAMVDGSSLTLGSVTNGAVLGLCRKLSVAERRELMFTPMRVVGKK